MEDVTDSPGTSKKLVARDSAIQLRDLEIEGLTDERSEIGNVISRSHLHDQSIICQYECTHIKDYEHLIPSHVYITAKYLYILRPSSEDDEGFIQEYIVRKRHKLSDIVKMTKKATMQDTIKIEYGTRDRVTDVDRLNIPKYADKFLKHVKSVIQPNSGSNSPAPHRRASASSSRAHLD